MSFFSRHDFRVHRRAEDNRPATSHRDGTVRLSWSTTLDVTFEDVLISLSFGKAGN
jgi:hypothetical protein